MFNRKKFLNTELLLRHEKIELKQLSEFFDGESAFEVRALTGEELCQVNEAGERVKSLSKVIDAIAQNEHGEAVKSMLGVDDGAVAEDFAKRIQAIVLGCVNPKIERQDALKIFKFYAAEAFSLTNKIFELTNLGAVPGKSKGSGET